MPRSQTTARSWPDMLPDNNKTYAKVSCANLSGLPKCLADEIESIVKRCLKILEISRDNIKSLQEKRDDIAMEELKWIVIDATQPCHTFIPLPLTHTHDLKKISVSHNQSRILKDMNYLLFKRQLHFLISLN